MKDKKIYYSLYLKAHNNAVDLLSEAEILLKTYHYARSYFLAFTALEELSKSQAAADVYTGLLDEDNFLKIYTFHNKKMDRIQWATLDANEYPNNIHPETGKIFHVTKPKSKKRENSLYTSINLQAVKTPKESISRSDVEEMIHTVNTALRQIMLMTEYYGHQIGTKGFTK
jgi:AbiV family abortive infection protein